MSDTSSDSDDSSKMEIEVENNNKLYCARSLVANAAALVTSYHVLKYAMKEQKRTSILSGHKWLHELRKGNENRFFKQFRMRKPIFYQLVQELTQNIWIGAYEEHWSR